MNPTRIIETNHLGMDTMIATQVVTTTTVGSHSIQIIIIGITTAITIIKGKINNHTTQISSKQVNMASRLSVMGMYIAVRINTQQKEIKTTMLIIILIDTVNPTIQMRKSNIGILTIITETIQHLHHPLLIHPPNPPPITTTTTSNPPPLPPHTFVPLI